MKQPVTELDTRFSDPDAVATDWEETRRALEEAKLFWISTVRADGRPHVTPLVAVWLDDAIFFATGPGEQKAVNLRTNQNVILAFAKGTFGQTRHRFSVLRAARDRSRVSDSVSAHAWGGAP
jgi:nitroimidazol reductase NimA-like FMN-containing flavoprotein (pyridoxamine 5'-phosphate oxidase superfamily)